MRLVLRNRILLQVKTFFFAFSFLSGIIHPLHENELHVFYSILNDDEGRIFGMGSGFFRGEFLSFSLKALLLGFVPFDGEPDYEITPLWREGYPVENTAFVFGEKGYIKEENRKILFSIATKNYLYKMEIQKEYPCAITFPSSGAEETFFIPYLFSSGLFKKGEKEIIVNGITFYWNLWGKGRISAEDHSVFCIKGRCFFVRFDLRRKKAKIYSCTAEGKSGEKEAGVVVKTTMKGKASGRVYPHLMEIKEEAIKILILSPANEAKLLTLSYIVSPVKVFNGGETAYGFIFLHPLPEERRIWEF